MENEFDLNIECFSEVKAAFNPEKCEWVPPHTDLTEEEKQELLEK